MGFTRDQLEAFRDAEVPDLVGPDPKLLFVGINPGLWTAAVQTHFAHPANRFYPALLEGGVIDWRIDPSEGMTEADRARFVEHGLGITNIVSRATARASELSTEELRDGAVALVRRIERWRPKVVAVAGITAYRTGFRRPGASLGRQEAHAIGGATVWAVPNPSGLNAHETVASLAKYYREVAIDSGVVSW